MYASLDYNAPGSHKSDVALWDAMHDGPNDSYKLACYNKSSNCAKEKLTILDHHCFSVE